MARIGIDTHWLYEPASGVGQYILGLIAGLQSADPENDYTLWGTPTEVSAPNFRNRRFEGKYNWAWEIYWRYLKYPNADIVGPKVDLWHFTNYFVTPTKRPYVVTIYDMVHHYFPETVHGENLKRLRKYLPSALEHAAHIIAISEATKRSYVEVMGIPEEKITVTLLAADSEFNEPASAQSRQAVRAKYALPESYLLAVGNLEPRKNLKTLLHAYAQLKPDERIPLVVVGGQGWLFDETKALIGTLGLESEVIFTGYADREELPALYQEATAFVYPTLYEGFGIPPLEAMASGTPVLSSNAASLPEVVGDAAITFDPTDQQAMTEALRRVLSDTALRQQLADAGQRQAAKFSWEETARQTKKVYSDALRTKNS